MQPWREPQGGLPGPALNRDVPGRLTFLYRHLVDVRSGPVLQLDHLPFKQLLSWEVEAKKWARRRSATCLPALVDAYGVSEFMPVTQAWVTFTMFSHSPLPKPQSGGTKGKDILPRGNLQVSPWATDPGVISSSAPARLAKVRASNLA